MISLCTDVPPLRERTGYAFICQARKIASHARVPAPPGAESRDEPLRTSALGGYKEEGVRVTVIIDSKGLN